MYLRFVNFGNNLSSSSRYGNALAVILSGNIKKINFQSVTVTYLLKLRHCLAVQYAITSKTITTTEENNCNNLLLTANARDSCIRNSFATRETRSSLGIKALPCKKDTNVI